MIHMVREKEKVNKGGALAWLNNNLYALKGNGTDEFYQDTPGNQWVQKSDIPTSNKTVKDGGSLTVDGDSIYALKGNGTLEFYVYNIAGDSWHRLPDLPEGPKNRSVKMGGALASDGNNVYALKGNNTDEVYEYNIRDSTWTTIDTLPKLNPATGRKRAVKGGGALAWSRGELYVLKGDKTNEFYQDTSGNAWVKLERLSSIE